MKTLQNKLKRKVEFAFILLGAFVFCILFQNCTAGFTTVTQNGTSSSLSIPNGTSAQSCTVSGVTYAPGTVVKGYALYSVVAPSTCGEVVSRTCQASGQFDGVMPVYDTCTALTPQSNSIDALPPGEWMEIPNSQIHDVFPTDNPAPGGAYAVIAAWSGGAFDTKRDRMIVWGGGHADYSGNEIYTFDLNTLKWSRLNNPSVVDPSVASFPSGYYNDGNPVARHSYNYLQYLPDPVDRFCTFGGAALWKTGQYGTSHTDCFNFDKNLWETQKFPDATSSGIGANSAYDPVTQTVWVHAGIGDTGMSKLDLKTGVWTALWRPFSGAGYTLGYHRTSDIDPINRTYVAVGEKKIITWDLTSTGPTNYGTEITTSGPQTIVNADSPGFVYVPDLNAFVGWGGGQDLYKLDIPTKTWTVMPMSNPSNVTLPVDPKNWGTFGRMRYSPKKKAIILITGERDNVLIYKVK